MAVAVTVNIDQLKREISKAEEERARAFDALQAAERRVSQLEGVLAYIEQKGQDTDDEYHDHSEESNEESAFHDMSIAEACVKVFREVEAHTGQRTGITASKIAEELRVGKFKTNSTNLTNTVYTTLKRRNDLFVLDDGRWFLKAPVDPETRA